MYSDFDLITHAFPGDITIYPVADVHLGAVEHCEPQWQAFLRKVEEEDAYLILAGDLLNNSTRGTRFANPFDEVLRPREAKKRMVEYLKPLAGRILCVTSGNHEQRTIREVDQDLTADICTKLDIEHLYRENVAYMAISLGQRAEERKPRATYTFCVTHGTGGGIYTGAAINRNERFGNIIDGLDCLILGMSIKASFQSPQRSALTRETRRSR